MCSYGPVVLGHQHPAVEAAARAQAEQGDCQNGPGAVMVELAELLVATVRHADWAMFAKNGTDATTICCTIARAQTGRSRILVATRRVSRRRAVVHAAAGRGRPRGPGQPRLLHVQRPGVGRRPPRARLAPTWPAIVVSPFKHDAGYDQELVDPAFARGLRELCTQTGAALILDDVRCGFRLHLGSSWEPIGVLPDLSAWSKAIANGHPLAAVLGSGRFRGRGREHLRHRVVLVLGGGRWRRRSRPSARCATRAPSRPWTGPGRRCAPAYSAQAAARGIEVNYTGPAAMPYLTFAGDRDHVLAGVFAAAAIRAGRLPASAAQLVYLCGDDRRRPGRRPSPRLMRPLRAVPTVHDKEGGIT